MKKVVNPPNLVELLFNLFTNVAIVSDGIFVRFSLGGYFIAGHKI